LLTVQLVFTLRLITHHPIRGTQNDIKKKVPGLDVNTHFNPTYNPWEQRLCLCPNDDMFKALKSGVARVATGHIDTFTERGIRLQPGAAVSAGSGPGEEAVAGGGAEGTEGAEDGVVELEADLIVTATGLNMQQNFPMSNIVVEVRRREALQGRDVN
jgi:cation diffusion facilitator CzcD-associated flavoprotein CzcO